MNNIQKLIFKTNILTQETPPDPGARATYVSGRYICQTNGTATIIDFTFRGNIYYTGDLASGLVTNMYTDAAMTIPVPYGFIRTNTVPKYLINFLGPGVVDFVQEDLTPC